MLLNEIVSTDKIKIVKAKGTPNIPGEKVGEGLFAKVYRGRISQLGIDTDDLLSEPHHEDWTDSFVAIEAFTRFIKLLYTSEGRSKIRSLADNEQFTEALDALERLVGKHMLDLGEENIMLRLTSVGPQLVLTDPVV